MRAVVIGRFVTPDQPSSEAALSWADGHPWRLDGCARCSHLAPVASAPAMSAAPEDGAYDER